MPLSVDADIPAGTDLLGKSVTDLQSDIEIEDGEISGTLKYVTGYTGFSGDTAEQTGNYLVLHIACEGATKITAFLTNGNATKPVTLDSDGLLISRITDKATQKLIFTAYGENISCTEEFDLTGLTLNEE
jgi:hypothetical protein